MQSLQESNKGLFYTVVSISQGQFASSETHACLLSVCACACVCVQVSGGDMCCVITVFWPVLGKIIAHYKNYLQLPVVPLQLPSSLLKSSSPFQFHSNVCITYMFCCCCYCQQCSTLVLKTSFLLFANCTVHDLFLFPWVVLREPNVHFSALFACTNVPNPTLHVCSHLFLLPPPFSSFTLWVPLKEPLACIFPTSNRIT